MHTRVAECLPFVREEVHLCLPRGDVAVDADMEVAGLMMKKRIGFLGAAALLGFSQPGLANSSSFEESFDRFGKEYRSQFGKDSLSELINNKLELDEHRERITSARENRDASNALNLGLRMKKVRDQKEKSERSEHNLAMAKTIKKNRPNYLNDSDFQMPNASEVCRVDFSAGKTAADEGKRLSDYLIKQTEPALKEDIKARDKALMEEITKAIQQFLASSKEGDNSDLDEQFKKDIAFIANPGIPPADRERFVADIEAKHKEVTSENINWFIKELLEMKAANEKDEELSEKVGELAADIGSKAPEFVKAITRALGDSARRLKEKCQKQVDKTQSAMQKRMLIRMAMQSAGGSPFGGSIGAGISPESLIEMSFFGNNLNNKCGDISKEIEGLFHPASSAANDILGADKDFSELLVKSKGFFDSILSGISQVMNKVNNSGLVEICELAASTAKKWCEPLGQFGMSCDQEGGNSQQAQLASTLGGRGGAVQSAAGGSGIGTNPALINALGHAVGVKQ